MTLDDAEKLAREVFARNASSKWGHPKYSCSINSQELRALTETLVTVLPVVRAAESVDESFRASLPTQREQKRQHYQEQGGRLSALRKSIDAMRIALEGK